MLNHLVFLTVALFPKVFAMSLGGVLVFVVSLRIIHYERVCSAGCYGTEGVVCGRTDVTEVLCTGIEVIPHLPWCRVPADRSGMVRSGVEAVPNAPI